uniref:ATP-binding cassette, subfamily B (MDR/TAP), member 1 n=1 Tax=Tetraselmis sp. GSL018 TaxID=582737 RepID=A0A061SI39_9CHLO
MWLRSKVALVSQEPTLFATSIYDNISFGSPEATEEQVHAAARMANADTFIRALPAGYSTSVGEGGVQLSGGQKQRIAIARAILKAPKVLLLDEATSALDSQSERLVQEALETVMAERTTIVVAHRLSTIRRANRICVLHQGRLVEQGSHAELIQNLDGAYSQLVALQHSPDTGGSRAALDSGNGLAPKAKSSSEASDSTGATVDSGIELAEKIPAKERRLFGFLGKRRKNAVAPDEEMGTSPGTVEDAQTSKSNMSRLIALNAKEWPLMILGSIGSAGLGSTMPALAYVLSSIITVFYSDGDDQEQKANMWCMIFALIGLASFIFGFLEQYSFGVMGARLATRIRCMLFAAILKQEVGWFDREENNSGAMTSMLGTDAAHIRGAVGDTFGIMFQNLFTFAAGFAIAFINNWKMTLVIIAAVPLLIFSGIIQAKVAQGMSDESTSKDAANADQVAMESFRNIRIVQAFNLQDSITDLWERHSTADAMAKSKRAHVTGIGFGVSQFSMFAVYSLAFWYGGQQVKDGEMSFDEMLKVFFAVLLGATGASNAQMSFPDAHKASDAAKRIFRVIDRVPRIDANDNAPPPKGGMVGSIVLDSVTFKYPNRPDVTVLQKLDLSINSGQMVALVGESGSGKSTIIGLVERFYDTAAGAVRIDGVDIKQLPIRWVRDNVGLVSQEPTLFAMTVKENIKLGRPNATDEEVREAAEHANAAAFIEALPEGYDTLVGDRGASLSGGQKQRVAIARAVLKDPRVLLLDEATSALDAENERLVADALEKLMAGRTTIVVAHRLSTIRNANVIAVMEHGKIVEQGTHDELLANNQNGPYARLIRLQQH